MMTPRQMDAAFEVYFADGDALSLYADKPSMLSFVTTIKYNYYNLLTWTLSLHGEAYLFNSTVESKLIFERLIPSWHYKNKY